MLTLFFRAIILYSFSVLAVRLMGKRQIGQLQPYELVAAILIADLVAEPMSGAETPLLYGIVPVSALVLMHSLFGILGMKSPAARRLLNGSARVLVLDGSIQYEELKRVCITVSDLLEMIRAAGTMSISDVGTAVLETNGALSVFPRAQCRAVSTGDMGLSPQEDTLPHILIADGKCRPQEIARAGLTRERLDAFLRRQGIGDQDRILLCALDHEKNIFLQLCGSQARRIQLEEALCGEA